MLTDKFANVAMLDEKWFYTTNRRRKIKRLPLGDNEKEGDDKVQHPQMRSRRELLVDQNQIKILMVELF